MTLAFFVWHFDVKLRNEGQHEPSFEDSFLVNRGSFEIMISPVNRRSQE